MTKSTDQDVQTTPMLDRRDERVKHAEGIGDSIRAFLDRIRSGDLGSLPVVVGLAIIWTVFQTLNPVFLAPNNLVNLLFDCSTVGVIALGIVCTFAFQALINLLVVTGLAPTKGIALPLVSSGGTGWCLAALAVGILMSIDREAGADHEPAPAAGRSARWGRRSSRSCCWWPPSRPCSPPTIRSRWTSAPC